MYSLVCFQLLIQSVNSVMISMNDLVAVDRIS